MAVGPNCSGRGQEDPEGGKTLPKLGLESVQYVKSASPRSAFRVCFYSTPKDSFRLTLYSTTLPFLTIAFCPTTSTPRMFLMLFDDLLTASLMASSKPLSDVPTSSITFPTGNLAHGSAAGLDISHLPIVSSFCSRGPLLVVPTARISTSSRNGYHSGASSR